MGGCTDAREHARTPSGKEVAHRAAQASLKQLCDLAAPEFQSADFCCSGKLRSTVDLM
jgi:hypothetical protein